ncbi:ATP-binding cassette domain-containing protein [Micromonospora endolithica]|uniref:ATP-binding cassette domain-containing protein n=1 Tax=Micromonospora endolithica TaxID=230091 RepID=A0A3A9YUC2_9ACTN|nr:ATP-binding cassette domain-containing protein [Micromonospora endolithica]RKN39379.1 ATP-binding cassette domain-containing protein [Micromonospora endolithica]TWJ22694.1 ABC-2 type transport system ATP-binding protein [Micromonospora endolithica]
METVTTAAVETVALRKSFGGVVVLDGLTMRVARGSVHALLGPNGAGKTTTVRILATLAAPDGGTARVLGHDVVRDRRRVRRTISLAGQHAALDDHQTGAENLEMMARLTGVPRAAARRRAADLLDRFDLAAAGGRRVVTYSGGMRRRLDLAASLVGQPSVIFLDEPTTGLDPRSRRGLWEVVGELAGAGVTVLLTTQYLEEADRLADRISVLHGGRLAAEGTATELKQRFGAHRLELTLRDTDRFAEVARRLGDRVANRDPARLELEVSTDGTGPRVRHLLDEVDPDRRGITRFHVRTATLDDVFLTLTGQSAPADRREAAGV